MTKWLFFQEEKEGKHVRQDYQNPTHVIQSATLQKAVNEVAKKDKAAVELSEELTEEGKYRVYYQKKKKNSVYLVRISNS